MTGPDFIVHAEKVQSLGPAGARSATSRAYYGAFHTAIAIVREFQCNFIANAQSHSLAYECFSNSPNQFAKKAAVLLSDLRHRRNIADYKLDHADASDQSYAEDSIATAKMVINKLTQFRNECILDNKMKTSWVSQVNQMIKLRTGQ